MDIAILTQIAQLGATAILLVILFFLWQEFKQQNQFIRDLITKSEAERVIVAQKLGMTQKEFDDETARIRFQMRDIPKRK